jgi:hypothetical protein
MQQFHPKVKPAHKTELTETMKTRPVDFAADFEGGSLLHLRRSLGNQALWRLMQPETEGLEAADLRGRPSDRRFGKQIQTKLKVNVPGDTYEQEADRIADQVVPGHEFPVSLSRTEGTNKGERDLTSGTRSLRAEGSSQLLPHSIRSYVEPRFGYDFSRVRVHSDPEASTMAESLNARAFTVGQDIFFGRQYEPDTQAGLHLLAHELTHVVQQGSAARREGAAHSFLSAQSGYLQRDIAENQLPNTPVEQIMADDKYFENGIKRIEFFGAELAILHYDDGSQIQLGLVPEEIKAPFEAVDYRTPRSSHIPVSSTAPSLGRGSIRFLPRGREAQFAPGLSFGDLPRMAQKFGRTIRFTHHPNGRIVPTEVNSISAPRLCQALREAEAEYVRRTDQIAKGAIEVLETLQWFIIVGSMVEGLLYAGSRAAAGEAATVVSGRAQNTLLRFFTRLLSSGTWEGTMIEGVSLGGVRVTMLGSELRVSYTVIENVSRIPARGRLIHGALEQAAIQAARQAGARTARVAVELVQEPKWAAYLESLQYSFQQLPQGIGEFGFFNAWTKVFTL